MSTYDTRFVLILALIGISITYIPETIPKFPSIIFLSYTYNGLFLSDIFYGIPGRA